MLADGVDDGLALFAPDGRVLAHNQALARLCQADDAMMDGLGDEAAIERHLVALLQATASGKQPEAPRLLVGAGRDIEVTRRPVESGYVAVYRDVTAQRRSERELRLAKEQAETANFTKSKFLANTSHELRTPLNAIIGFAEMLHSEMFGPLGSARYVGYARDIHASGQHLLGIINDLLDLAKIEAGRFELREGTVALTAIVEASLRLVAAHAAHNGQTLRSDLPADLPTLWADDRILTQVLVNLLSNAIKFTARGGEIVIAARADPSTGVELSVTDNGIGIAAADIDVALTPFGQVDAAFNRRYQGTGLGLPLAKHLVELHQGSLSIDSNPGIGTRVRVQLPAKRITLTTAQ
ncbi:MAG: HAMP domain-containing sensor histidine kinase [Alphaproteobacteria bacterium]